jgi:ribokinase
MQQEVVVVGSYNQDHAWRVDRFPQAGETRRGSGFSTGPGGKGFNQAVACARQQVGTAFLGARGHDASGLDAERQARAEGLADRWLLLEDVPTGTAAILVDDQGQNQIIVDLAANERLDPDFLHLNVDVFTGAKVLLTQMENNASAIHAALKLGHEHGLTCLLNPAPVHPDLDPAVLELVDVLLPNESEFAQLCQRCLEEPIEAERVVQLDNATLHALARRLCRGTVVITLGRHGALVSHGQARRGDREATYRMQAETVHSIDTSGAGDAFCGSLAAGLVLFADSPFTAAVRHAGRVAALSTERRGTTHAMPHHVEVTARFG